MVEFATEAGATAAIDTLSNSVLQGRAIGVREDKGTGRAAVPRRTGEYSRRFSDPSYERSPGTTAGWQG